MTIISDIKIIQKEVTSMHKEIKTLQADVRTTNNILNAILKLMKLNVNKK